jgi:hypothetical protein
MPAKKKVPAKSNPAISGGLLIPEKIAPLVHLLRHEKVILDSDLAELYGVTTGVLNQAVQRNLDRFPSDFMFQVTENELETLKCQSGMAKNEEPTLKSQSVIAKNAESDLRFQSGISKGRGGRRTLPTFPSHRQADRNVRRPNGLRYQLASSANRDLSGRRFGHHVFPARWAGLRNCRAVGPLDFSHDQESSIHELQVSSRIPRSSYKLMMRPHH